MNTWEILMFLVTVTGLLSAAVMLVAFGLLLRNGWYWLHEALRTPVPAAEDRNRRIRQLEAIVDIGDRRKDVIQ